MSSAATSAPPTMSIERAHISEYKNQMIQYTILDATYWKAVNKYNTHTKIHGVMTEQALEYRDEIASLNKVATDAVINLRRLSNNHMLKIRQNMLIELDASMFRYGVQLEKKEREAVSDYVSFASEEEPLEMVKISRKRVRSLSCNL